MAILLPTLRYVLRKSAQGAWVDPLTYTAGSAGGAGPGLYSNQQAQAESNRQAAQDRAFSLQQAMAARMAAATKTTPAADHIKEQADIERENTRSPVGFRLEFSRAAQLKQIVCHLLKGLRAPGQNAHALSVTPTSC